MQLPLGGELTTHRDAASYGGVSCVQVFRWWGRVPVNDRNAQCLRRARDVIKGLDRRDRR